MPIKDQDTTSTAFARGPQSDVFGKMDDELPPIRISGDVRIEVRRLAAEAHMTESEFVRNLVHVRCFGIDHVVSMQAERLRRATGNAEPLQSKVAS